MLRFVLLVVSLLAVSFTYAQSTYKSGLMPQFNLSSSLKNDWKLNAKLEGRLILFQGEMGKAFKAYSEAERADLEIVASKNLNNVNSIGGGYLIRNEQGNWIHRFIQQYTHSDRYSSFKLVHRVRTDQTFEPDADVIFRLRYRASFEFPLNGKVVDPEEFYLKLNNEYIGWIQGSITEMDIRALLALGYQLNKKYKFETGLDYRAEEIIDGGTKNHFWLTMGCYVSF